ncbi:MAG: HigA family addiction module antitoxin [Balneolaceae bacterium]|nr:HigA family addiction module antitoxin [Balneolaceae bacterium]
MLPKNRTSTHPGVVLFEEFLNPLDITQQKLSDHLGIPIQRINEIVNGKRGISPETAWLLAGAFQTTPEFWMNLQANYDLTKHRPDREIQPLESLDN